MKSKFLAIDGFDIFYLEKNNQSNNIIFFIHGNSNSSRLWQHQFNDDRLSDYHLIAIDLPGHGQSSFSSDPTKDYSVQRLGDLTYQIIKRLCSGKSLILCGFSLGSNVAAEVLAFEMKPKGVILISPTVVGESVKPQDLNDKEIIGKVLFSENVEEDDLIAYLNLASPSTTDGQNAFIKEDYLKTDKKFRTGLMESALNGALSDEIKLINDSKIDCLMISNQNDKVVTPDLYNFSNLFSNTVEFVTVNMGGHYLPLEIPDQIIKNIAKFCNRVFRDSLD